MLRGLFLSVALTWSSTSLAASQSLEDEARACARAGDYECAFEKFSSLAEDASWPLADENDVRYLSGAMLEASIIEASKGWSAAQLNANAKRYLDILVLHNPDSYHGFGTAYALLAFSCHDAVDSECYKTYVSALCKNKSQLSAPMGNHPNYEEFADTVVQLLQEECGV